MIYVSIAVLAFIQNIAFTLVSRARNRDSLTYHAVMSVLSNSVFFLTFRELILADMNWWMFVPYVGGTVLGSLFGAKVALRIERLIGARADSHV